MTPTWQLVFILTNFVLAGVLGWQVFLFKSWQANKEAIATLRLHVAENYVRKDDMQESFTRLENKLDKLFEELHKRTASRAHHQS